MWEKIKRILSRQGGKCIIVEDNQPSYVVMKLEDYEKMGSDTEEANRDVDQWKAEQDVKSEPEIEEKEEVKVEDLPF